MTEQQPVPTRPYKARALLFGLNYAHEPTSKLSGCVNDVRNMAAFLQTELKLKPEECGIYTDDVDMQNTSCMGIVNKLYEMAVLSYRESLDFVWIHYSGHGSYIADRSGDEKDGKDECLVPSDYKSRGLLSDDCLNSLFKLFNPNTRIVFVFDCCHSGTIGDVKYSWEGPENATLENIKCAASGKVITISGCLDTQVSMDAYNAFGDNKFAGAMTSCLLLALKEDRTIWQDVFKVVSALRKKLKAAGFAQVPKLCSSHNLAKDSAFVPAQ
jgi:metacaspase-1